MSLLLSEHYFTSFDARWRERKVGRLVNDPQTRAIGGYGVEF